MSNMLYTYYWRLLTACPLKMGSTGCPETSVLNYRPTSRKIREVRRSHLYCYVSLKSQTVRYWLTPDEPYVEQTQTEEGTIVSVETPVLWQTFWHKNRDKIIRDFRFSPLCFEIFVLLCCDAVLSGILLLPRPFLRRNWRSVRKHR